VTSHEEAVRK